MSQYPWATAAGWFVSLCDLQQTHCTSVTNVCCPFQDMFSLLINSLPGLDHRPKPGNDTYNKPQILISHLIAFRVALRVSSHCVIILEWMSGKGWHVVNLCRWFSFHRYNTVMPGSAAICICFKQADKLTLVLGSAQGRTCGIVIQTLLPEDEK